MQTETRVLPSHGKRQWVSISITLSPAFSPDDREHHLPHCLRQKETGFCIRILVFSSVSGDRGFDCRLRQVLAHHHDDRPYTVVSADGLSCMHVRQNSHLSLPLVKKERTAFSPVTRMIVLNKDLMAGIERGEGIQCEPISGCTEGHGKEKKNPMNGRTRGGTTKTRGCRKSEDGSRKRRRTSEIIDA